MRMMSCFFMSLKCSCLVRPWSGSILRDGVNFLASECQFGMTDVGAMTSDGSFFVFLVLLFFSASRWVRVWSVLPRPMSSARTPLRL